MEDIYKYNHKDWPNFTYSLEKLSPFLKEIYKAHGKVEGRFELASLDMMNERITAILADDIYDNAAIEGQILDIEDVRGSVRKSLGFEETDRRFKSEGNTQVIVDAIENTDVLTKERLFQWHSWYFPNGNPEDPSMPVGAYTEERMEIRSASGKVLYIAPPVSRINMEMNMFLMWMQSSSMDVFIKAGIAHLWFEIIHPFGDGNGRIGRNIINYILAQEFKNSIRTIGLSTFIKKHKATYYSQLEYHSKGYMEITVFLEYFLITTLEAIKFSNSRLDKMVFRTKFWSEYQSYPFNQRQKKVIEKLLNDDFEGVLTVRKWSRVTAVGYDTANSDIKNLVEVGVLVKSSEGERNKKFILNRV